MKNKIFIGILSVTLISIVTVFFIAKNQISYIESDYAIYDNENDFVNEATDIIVGEIIDSKAEKIKVAFTEGRKYENDEDKMMYNISNVKVLKEIKGELKKGDIIQIKQIGDGEKVIDKTILENGGYYQKGGKKIFFLKSFKKYGVPYSVINPIQGQIDIELDKIKENKNNKLFKGRISENELIEEIKKFIK